MTRMLAVEEIADGSPVAILIILALALATVLLIVSMMRHLRRVPPSFDRDPDERDPDDRHSPT